MGEGRYKGKYKGKCLMAVMMVMVVSEGRVEGGRWRSTGVHNPSNIELNDHTVDENDPWTGGGVGDSGDKK